MNYMKKVDNIGFGKYKFENDDVAFRKVSNLMEIYFGEGTAFYLSPEEVDEFCELLQEKKKEIWK